MNSNVVYRTEISKHGISRQEHETTVKNMLTWTNLNCLLLHCLNIRSKNFFLWESDHRSNWKRN